MSFNYNFIHLFHPSNFNNRNIDLYFDLNDVMDKNYSNGKIFIDNFFLLLIHLEVFIKVENFFHLIIHDHFANS
jgi:hypothetical protein